MSHNKERKEKNCLNCGTTVAGRYCQRCGQENTEPDLTVKGLIRHFLYDITHFDGKYFDTVKTLFTKPGFLGREYIRGRKAAYLDPARMYIFTSAVFFFLYYNFFFHVSETDIRTSYSTTQSLINKLSKLDSSADFNINLNEKIIIRNGIDTLLEFGDEAVLNHFVDSLDLIIAQRKDSLPDINKAEDIDLFGFSNQSREAYDSAQLVLPKEKRDSWSRRMFKYRQIKIFNKYHGDNGAYIADLVYRFTHSYPTILFIMLPVLAMILRLLYLRRKETNVAHHGIFLVYLFIFLFLTLILYFLLEKMETGLNWTWIRWLRYISIVGIFFYTYKAMRTFYLQGRFKTLLHFISFLFCSAIIILLVFGIYFTFVVLNS